MPEHESNPPTHGLPSTLLDGCFYKRTLQLYVVDNRIGSKSSATIGAVVADRIGCAPGEWRVEARHVLEELQKTISQISGPGPVKVGVPDIAFPEFTTYFVEASVKKLTTASTSPTHLVVPANEQASLTLRVEYRTTALKLICADMPSEYRADDDDAPQVQFPKDFVPLTAARQRAHGSYTRRDCSPRPQNSPSQPGGPRNAELLVALTDLVALRPGYQMFDESRHTVLQNPDIVPIWKFIAAFLKDYCDKDISEISDRAPGKRITKRLICIALGIGETCLKQAEDGARLVGLYGAGGKCEAAKVIEELEARRDAPTGIGKIRLLRFLRDWEAAHPIPKDI
ncbi:hypothetical protein D9615_004051 [Tricholomella constricta]|uniref:Uncharacterized protein n=1 Tax=Tricholomella constricta TaxID=117010 RepID=A0A8H5HD15_9AGAR|nr:hypothetical protein D9615_004051 [Tricholomella constricta]